MKPRKQESAGAPGSSATAWGKYNINVSCIAPTWIMTPMLAADEPHKYLRAVNEMHECGAIAEVYDPVGTSLYPASAASIYI